jgi:hypothetical protein
MKINDKEWLERVTIGYKVYQEQVEKSQSIEQFIEWLYKQYGIIQPKKGTQ